MMLIKWLLVAILSYPVFGQTSKPASQPATKPTLEPFVYYRGKARTRAWFDRMYKKFGPQFTLYRGKFYPAPNAVPTAPPFIVLCVPPIWGTECRTAGPSHTLQELPDGSALMGRDEISRPGKATVYHHDPEVETEELRTGRPITYGGSRRVVRTGSGKDEPVTFHVECRPEHLSLSDNMSWLAGGSRLVYIGTFSYRTVLDKEMTVQNYVRYEPLTAEQFKTALESGVKLINCSYRRFVGQKLPYDRDMADSWKESGKDRDVVLTYQILAKPVD